MLLVSTRELADQLEEVPNQVEVVKPERKEPNVALQVEVWVDHLEVVNGNIDLGRKTLVMCL